MKKTNLFTFLLLLLLPTLVFSQESLNLNDCNSKLFEINDHSDVDNDGNVCEAKITLTNSASYENNLECDQSSINWIVTVDIDNDGVKDVEYRSDLPSTDVSLDDTNNNGIPDLYIPPTTNNEVQNIPLIDVDGPMSNHQVEWAVSDECDLSDVCNVDFVVADKKAPTPYCASSLTFLYDGHPTMIYAEDFNVGSFDNCTSMENIRASFSQDSIMPAMEITCDEVLNSPISVDVYFWDDSNNRDFCTTYLNVLPAHQGVDCFPIEDSSIFGNIRDCNGQPLEGVEVRLDTPLPENPSTVFTDQAGNYSFGPLPNFTDYTISVIDDYDSALSNVSTLDLVKILRHILGFQSFTKPYKIIASDTNGDNMVNVLDILSMRKVILGVINEFPNSPNWRFIDAEFEFEDDSDPFTSILAADPSPYTIEFNGINPQGFDFIGIKVGNVSN